MASVVFLRAVNVGGHQKLQPSLLARHLSDLDVVNVGAAGTFVVRKAVAQTALRTQVLRQLPFKPQLMICAARDILALTEGKPFGDAPLGSDVRQFVSVMQNPPATLLRFPLDQPTGEKWQVRIVAIRSRFAISLWRPQRRGMIYPNAVVEKQFGVPATTRSWRTILAVCRILGA